METSINTRENAIEWWILQTDEYKEMQFSEFIKTHYTPSPTFNTLSGREIEIIYSTLKLSENAIKANAAMNTNITYELKKEIYNYHTDLHKNDRGMGGSIHKRVRERFNLPSDTISSIIQEMKGKEAIAENEILKARCETYKKDYDSMVKEVLRLSGQKSELLEALNMAVPFLNIVTYSNQKGYEKLMYKIHEATTKANK